MKRKIGLLLAAVTTVGATTFAAIGTARAAEERWHGPYGTQEECYANAYGQVRQHGWGSVYTPDR